MKSILSVIIGAALLLAIIGWLIRLVIREAKEAQAARDASQLKDQDIARKQAQIIAENRDPDSVSNKLRNGSF